MVPFSARHVALLRCPLSGADLHIEGDELVADPTGPRYSITASGVALLANGALSRDGAAQRDHYDSVATQYLSNLTYPHTREYFTYLDRALLTVADAGGTLGTVAEICCGAGEGLRLLGSRAELAIGVDVSIRMLEAAVAATSGDVTRAFVQGDATRLPLKSQSFDTVAMLGGVHHVNDRRALFAEVARILKPGGRFFFREPVDDFVVWRLVRRVIYRTASSLDAATEHPLRHRPTVDRLAEAGLRLTHWQTFGFIAYCALMNSDVMPVFRFWQYVPGVRGLTRAAARFDQWTLRIPGLSAAGVLAIGAAVKTRK
jgi:SAM-dependent methyltransferase